MLFNSWEYLIYFPIVTLIYFLLKFKYRYIFLLFASYYFYMNWNPKYAILMGFSTVVTYLSGIYIERGDNLEDVCQKEKYKKRCVFYSFLINLSILFFFKYFNFLSENINYLSDKMSFGLTIPKFTMLLPVGISFYTFQALSYTMDVYRGDIKPQKNILKYALFVSFFPQLVAGPIERSTNLIKQLDKENTFDYERVKNGILLIGWGLVKKMVIADRLSAPVNMVYNNPQNYKGAPLLIATILFAFQIYCDFSSYSDIAIGSANVLGYDLMKNFNRPYLSKSIAEFWRRWHISLGTWFKDYMYIPLGGNKVDKMKRYRNILIIFLTSGLWHGASWNFIIWGGLHGVYQIFGRELKIFRDLFVEIFKIKRGSLLHKSYQIVVTFILVDFAWIFFRANSFNDAIYIVKNMFVDLSINSKVFESSLRAMGVGTKKEVYMILLLVIVLETIHIIQSRNSIKEWIKNQNLVLRGTVYYIILFSILILGVYGNSENSQFIYFQF